MFYPLLRSLLFRLPPETAHHLSLESLAFFEKTGLWQITHKKLKPLTEPHHVMGLAFPNRIGLAAGLDKNGEYIDALAALGFGFVEVGTVTPHPQAGNEKPRLFRLPEVEAIINRMGFNNKGVDYLLQQLEKTRYRGILGINIGKNFSTAVEHAVDDYLIAQRKVYSKASYITVNISSPNTPGLRNLQYGKELTTLLFALKAEQQQLAEKYERYVPLAVKVAPDLEPHEIAEIADIFQTQNIDAVIATNTTIVRDSVKHLPYGNEQGGLSGRPVAEKSTAVLAEFYRHFQGDIPLIAVGGVDSVEAAQAKLKAGAELVQIYTGLIYKGAPLIRDCIKALG